MSEELKPCPFCGGGARIETSCIDTGWYVGVITCQHCFAQFNSTDGDTEKEAITNTTEAWNTRHERTCSIEFKVIEFGDRASVCSECGNMNMYDRFSGNAHSFCPNCGAKVVQE